MCRTTGTAFGNTLAGLLLHFGGLGWGMSKMDEHSTDALSRDSYPIQGYVIMQIISICMGLLAVWLVWDVPRVKCRLDREGLRRIVLEIRGARACTWSRSS